MRRYVILAARRSRSASAAATSFRDLFSAHADVAAEAGGQQLPAQRLAQILSSGGKGVKVDRETADFVANIWVDYALLGQAVAQRQAAARLRQRRRGGLAGDLRAQGHALARYADGAPRPRSADAAVDSLYKAPDYADPPAHPVRRAAQAPTPPQNAAIKTKAEATLAQIRKGASFDQLASSCPRIPGSKADSGYPPAEPQGPVRARVRQRRLDAAAGAGERRWSRRRSATTSSSGPPWTRPAAHLVTLSGGAGGRRGSTRSTWTASPPPTRSRCCRARRPPCGPRPRRRTRARSPTRRWSATTAAQLTVKDYLRWVRALPPQYTAQLKRRQRHHAHPVRPILTQNVLLLREADANKIAISPLEWASLKRRYVASSTRSRPRWGCRRRDLTDSSVALAEREKVAGLKVERYFDELIAGKTRLRPLPSALATLLRERLPYSVHEAGVSRRHRARGRGIKAKADSAAPKGADAAGARRPAGPGHAARRPPATRRPDAGVARAERRLPPGRTAEAVQAAAGPGSGAALAGAGTARAAAAAESAAAAATRPPAAPADSAAARRRDSVAAAAPARHSAAASLRSAGTGALPDTAVVVDRVVAVVGNRPVLASQVDEEIFSRQSQGQQLPTDPDSLEAIRKQVVASIVDEELLVQQAQRDTTHQGDRPGDRRRRRAAGAEGPRQLQLRGGLQERAQEGRLPDARGVPPLAHRPAAAGGVPEPADRQAAQDGKLKPVPPTEKEMRAYFDEQKGSLGSAPGHALVPPDRHRAAPVAGGQGADQGAGRFDRAGAPARGGLRHRRQAVLAGPRLQGPGRLAQLVPPGRDGARVRAGGVRAQARRGVRPGRVAVRLPHHPGRADSARRGPGPAHPARPGRSIRSTSTAPAPWPSRCARSDRAGRSFDSLQRLYHDPSAERQADNVPVDKLPEAYAKVDRRGRLGRRRAGLQLPGAGDARPVRGRCRSPAAARRATSGTRTCATASASSSASSSPSAGTSTGCESRRTSRCGPSGEDGKTGGRSGRFPPRLAITLGDPRGIGPEIAARALAEPLAAEITVVGAEDQIAGVPAAAAGRRRHLGAGQRRRAGGPGAGDPRRPHRRPRGRDGGQAGAERAKSTRSSPRPPTSTPCTWRAFPIPGTPNGWRKLAGDVDVAMMLAPPARASRRCWSRPTCPSATCRRCSRSTGSSGPAASRPAALRSGAGSQRPRLARVRGQPARGRVRPVRGRGRAGTRPGRRRRSARRGRCRRTPSSSGRCGGVRRGARALSRRGDDGDQGGGVRPGGERDAGSAVSADLAGPRDGARHRGDRQGGSVEHAGGDRAGGELAGRKMRRTGWRGLRLRERRAIRSLGRRRASSLRRCEQTLPARAPPPHCGRFTPTAA